MIFNLTAITVLIYLILYMTWLKDGEHMTPPLNRRVIIDTSMTATFWILYGLYYFGALGLYDKELSLVLNLALTFFLVRLFQLMAQINPLFKDLMDYIKEKRGKNE